MDAAGCCLVGPGHEISGYRTLVALGLGLAHQRVELEFLRFWGLCLLTGRAASWSLAAGSTDLWAHLTVGFGGAVFLTQLALESWES